MSDEDTLRHQQQQVDQGQRAQRLLQDEVFLGAVSRLEARLCQQWRNSKPDEQLAREHAYYTMHALREVLTEISKEADAGRVAESHLRRTKRG